VSDLDTKVHKDDDFTKVDEPTLVADHFYLHSMWNRLLELGTINNWSRDDIIQLHTRLVRELLRRDMNHNYNSSLDGTLPDNLNPKKREKKGLLGRVLDAFKSEAPQAEPSDEEPYYWDLKEARRVDWIQDFNAVIEHIRGKRILDIGCGNGAAIETLLRSGYEALGIDHNKTAIDWCLSKGLNVIQGDFEQVDIEALAHFDTALLMHVLEHAPDPYALLSKALEVADRAVCVLPLGPRGDNSHLHVIDMEFAHALGSEFDAGYHLRELGNGNALLVIDNSLNVEKVGDVLVTPHFVSIVGSSAEPGKFTDLSDIDILIRAPKDRRDENLELAIRKQLPKALQPLLHFLYAPTGPNDKFMPVYDLKCVRRTPDKLLARNAWSLQGDTAKAVSVRPFRTFLPLKSSGGFDQHTFFQADEMWAKWAKENMAESPLAIEPKYDGYRLAVHSDGEDRVELNTLEERHNLAAALPGVAAQVKKLSNSPFIIDGELMEMVGGVATPRKDLAKFFSDEPPSDRNVVLFIYDILFEGEDDTHLLTLEERRRRLSIFLKGKSFDHIRLGQQRVARSRDEFFSAIDDVRRLEYSEGAMVKRLDSKYPLSGRTSDWAKLRNFMKVDVEVTARDKKGSGYRYTCAYRDKNGELADIGNTFVTNDNYAVGSIVEVNTTHVTANEHPDGTTTFTWFLPRIKGPSAKRSADSHQRLLALSKIPEGRYVPKALCPECPHTEPLLAEEDITKMVCPQCGTALMGGPIGPQTPTHTPATQEPLTPSDTPQPTAIPSDQPNPTVAGPTPSSDTATNGAAGQVSFAPGGERRVTPSGAPSNSESEITLRQLPPDSPPEAFLPAEEPERPWPWLPLLEGQKAIKEASLDLLDFDEGETSLKHLTDKDRSAAIIRMVSDKRDTEETVDVPGRKGYFLDKPTGNAFVWQHHVVGLDEDEIDLTYEQMLAKKLIASVHGDFRLDWGKNYLEGFTLFTPGNFRQPDKLLLNGKTSTNIAGTIKNPQPKAWLGIDNKVFAPGEPGARPNTFAKMFIADTGTFIPSIQENGYHEFLLKFKKHPELNGIWGFSSRGLEEQEGVGHMFFKVNSDKPYYLRHPKKAEDKKIPDWQKPKID
jgi:SAM-dependent methyltransferase